MSPLGGPRGEHRSAQRERNAPTVHSVVAALLCVLALALPASETSAATAPRVALEQLTWPEVQAAIAAGKTTALVPIGGTEQNGPHMVLGKHNERVRVLAARIAEKLGNALVAPVIAYVPEGNIEPPTQHMRFPGTISVPPATFIATLEATGRSLRAAGFRDVVFLGDHGGYQKELRVAADHLNRAWARSGVRAHALEEYYRVTDTTFRKELVARGFTEAEIGVHAGLADTALTLAVDPRLVRTERMAAAVPGRDGVQGDPRRATAELGQLGVDAVIDASVQAIRRDVAR